MEQSPFAIVYRSIVFALAAGFVIHTSWVGTWAEPGGPLRYLTVWALWASTFVAFRVLLISLGYSTQRYDGFVSAVAVVNAMVVLLYWRLYFADPHSVTKDGELGIWWREYYMHGLGAVLMWIDALFINRVFRSLVRAFVWLIGFISAYLAWAELFVGRFNDAPVGSVTSGLPYPFLNNLELAGRMNFYITNIVVAIVLLCVFATLAWGLRRTILRQS